MDTMYLDCAKKSEIELIFGIIFLWILSLTALLLEIIFSWPSSSKYAT